MNFEDKKWRNNSAERTYVAYVRPWVKSPAVFGGGDPKRCSIPTTL